MKITNSIEQLTPAAQYVVNYFITHKVQRKNFSKLDPRHNERMIGLEEAINAGFLTLKEHPIERHVFYVRPTKKTMDLYVF